MSRFLVFLILLAAPVMDAKLRTEPVSLVIPPSITSDYDAILRGYTAKVNSVVSSSYIKSVMATGSMEPAFNERYLILYQIAAQRPLNERRVGDVILYWGFIDEELMLICHRIIAISSGGSIAVVKGDANERPDKGYVTAESYVGLVVGWVRCDLSDAPIKGAEPVRLVIGDSRLTGAAQGGKVGP